MKKFILCFFFVFGIISSTLGAPAYGPKMPQKHQFHLGGQTYSVFEGELEGTEGEVESLMHFLLISFGVTDWLSLDLKGGAGDTHHKRDGSSEISYPAFVGGGYGFRIKAHETEKTKIIAGFQHISIHPYSVKINGVKHKAVLDDWQLSFLGSYDLNYASPYLGFRWSRFDYIHWVDDERNRVKSDVDKSYGIIAGFDAPINSRTWINIEGQFVDVEAVSASINFSF